MPKKTLYLDVGSAVTSARAVCVMMGLPPEPWVLPSPPSTGVGLTQRFGRDRRRDARWGPTPVTPDRISW